MRRQRQRRCRCCHICLSQPLQTSSSSSQKQPPPHASRLATLSAAVGGRRAGRQAGKLSAFLLLRGVKEEGERRNGLPFDRCCFSTLQSNIWTPSGNSRGRPRYHNQAKVNRSLALSSTPPGFFPGLVPGRVGCGLTDSSPTQLTSNVSELLKSFVSASVSRRRDPKLRKAIFR